MDSSPVQQLPIKTWNSLAVEFQWIYRLKGLNKHAFRYPQKTSDCYIATWVISGSQKKRHGIREVEVHAGEWLFQHPGNVPEHYAATTSTMEVAFYLHWHGEGRLLFPPRKLLWNMGRLPSLEQPTRQLYDITCSNVKIANPFMRTEGIEMSRHLAMRHAFHRWFAALSAEWDKQGMGLYHAQYMEDRMVLAKRYLEQHPLDAPLDIQRMAYEAGCSIRHLIRLFVKEFRTTPQQYWMQLKLQAALNDLQSTTDSTEKIAVRLGCSRVWLHLWIKKVTGKTPNEIRKEAETRASSLLLSHHTSA